VRHDAETTDVLFDPLVASWFTETFTGATPPQEAGWRRIAARHDTLIAAPTGSGKTLAAFLWAIDELVREARAGKLADATAVVYVSPLKALGNDIEKNLAVPLAAIRERAAAAGVDLQDIRVAVRSGDTPQAERQAMLKHPPHVLITTPESLYILLTAEKSREMLRSARTVIVDEIHAVAGDKRGAHLALTLARLDRLVGRRLQRIGLSATQKPIEEIAALLVGEDRVGDDGTPDCAIVDTGHKRAMELSVETTDLELGAIASHELRATVYDRVVELVGQHRTTIVFVNTRRLVERVAHALGERLGAERVVAHHGSLSRRIRLAAEQKLKSGEVPVVVATASLELGIDVGHVDLVCHLGAPRALATLLQRVGRSGHWLGSVPKGIFFPFTRDELMQTAAAVRAIRQGELDRILMPESPLDILAQQMVATAASEEISTDDLFTLVRRAWPFRRLTREAFEEVLEMLAEGVSTRRGRRSAHLHHDRVQERVRGRRGARLAAITSGGAIPETADYDVIEDPTEARVGKVNEDFAIESMRGDIFLLGNHSWRIRRVEAGKVRVEDAGQTPPTIPFWMGEAPARTRELSQAVSDLRQAILDRLSDPPAAIAFLVEECGMDASGAQQLVAYVAATVAVLGTVPTCERVVAERFFDESGGMQLVLHAPFGGAINRAFGLALRKSFCVGFDFELQAAATDDGIVLSLGEQHSFPLDGVFGMVRRHRLEDDLIQAVLQAPMFGTRWRWNASRALALLRHQGGKKVPMNIQRMRAEDLLAAVFPAQLGCGDNRTGPIEPVDHPLVNETLDNCLHEAMDTEGLRRILERIDAGEIRTVAVETPAPSQMAHELLNAYPYAFLDDAPLEERRARAVTLRRTDASLAQGIGALDQAAIDEVREQAWPDVRDADELHDALEGFGWLPLADVLVEWRGWLDELIATRRATIARWTAPDGATHVAVVSAERSLVARRALPEVAFETAIEAPRGSPDPVDDEQALDLAVRGWIQCTGPISTAQLAQRLGIRTTAVEAALARCELDGCALRGRFTPGASEEEWCERRLLARIHRLTLGRLRREIDPVSIADFTRYLFRWQHVASGSQLHGRDGLTTIITQLHGLELPAPAWERSVFPLRVHEYAPGLLDDLCFSGIAVWGRFSPPASEGAVIAGQRRRRTAPTRNAPLAVALREELEVLRTAAALREPEMAVTSRLSRAARDVLDVLRRDGASFLGDVARASGLLPSAAEEALWELVARGLVTGDGFAGLRTLLTPDEKRRPERRLRALRGGRAAPPALAGGRGAVVRPRGADLELAKHDPRDPRFEQQVEENAEAMARVLLRRYGVVLRELTVREPLAPPWRHLLVALRRMEARGEIRGGRFVSGLIGEQFALPEAVEALRAVRRLADDGEIVLIASADPLNLVGILTPGARVPATSGQVIAFQRGVPIEAGELGAVRSRLQSHARGA
jgi:ATP-dependent Lhr-like helicase